MHSTTQARPHELYNGLLAVRDAEPCDECVLDAPIEIGLVEYAESGQCLTPMGSLVAATPEPAARGTIGLLLAVRGR
jgi:hypothetical protein